MGRLRRHLQKLPNHLLELVCCASWRKFFYCLMSQDCPRSVCPFAQNHTKNPVHGLLGAREQQRPGCLREPHVQHQHQGRGGQGRALRPQPEHGLHHGLMTRRPRWKRTHDSDAWRDHTLKEGALRTLPASGRSLQRGLRSPTSISWRSSPPTASYHS